MQRNLSLNFIIFFFTFILISCSSGDSPTEPDPGQNNPDTTTVDADAPPLHWYDDFQGWDTPLHRVYYDKYVVVYYDPDVPQSVKWPFEFMSSVWKYVTGVYGRYGEENRLYAIYHGKNKTGTARTGNIFDDFNQHRSMANIPLIGYKKEGWNIGSSVHEVGHTVEGSSHGVHSSPAFGIWKDSKWAEIFNYDVFKGIGMEEAAKKRYNSYMRNTDDFPRPGTNWFKDWFYPIYHNYGESEVLNRFFLLLSNYFPQKNHEYTRGMNYGEFVHFWSGAAHKDLQPLAKEAFGWSAGWQIELEKARKKFIDIQYDIESPTLDYEDLTTDATLQVSDENGGGPNDDEGSKKLTDDDDFTKFYLGGYTSNFWAEQLFQQPKTINAYTITSGNDYEGRDPKDWKLEGSNDNENWTVIDTQAEVDFSRRNKIKVFLLDSEVSYPYYRLSVTANAGAPDFQISEWRLLNMKN